jgi:hypothetical protein
MAKKINPPTLSELMAELAEIVEVKLGHMNLEQWTIWAPQQYRSVCKDCGACVHIASNPKLAPIKFGGTMIERKCKKGRKNVHPK